MPPNETSNEIKLGILGRTQRDNKVDLCHFVDMNNHSHNLAVSSTPAKLSKFYMELQKKTTDAVKALMGLSSLSLWEDRTTVARIATLDDVIDRIVYIYCNPSSAALCDSIDDYAGVSSWEAFLHCEASVDAEVTSTVRWYPVSEIPKLPSPSLSPRQDATLHQQLTESEFAITHTLSIKPFKWLETYGITEPSEIERIRQRIIARVRETERASFEARAAESKRSIPRAALRQAPFMKPHTPKKNERKIFVICGDKLRRLEIIRSFKGILARCRECYQKAKAGVRVDWPPGTFVPWFPPGFTFPLPANS